MTAYETAASGGKQAVKAKRCYRKTKAFDLVKYAKQLEAVGQDEANLTPEEALDVIEDLLTDNPHAYPYYKTYWQLHKHFKLDVVAFFSAILNIRRIEKKSSRSGCFSVGYLKKAKGRPAKELLRAIQKYPTLRAGWFCLPEERLMRDLNITRHAETRLIAVLRDAGLVVTFLHDMPRKRFVRVNYKKLLSLLDYTTEDET